MPFTNQISIAHVAVYTNTFDTITAPQTALFLFSVSGADDVQSSTVDDRRAARGDDLILTPPLWEAENGGIRDQVC